MTQHAELIERLRYEPTASQYLSLTDLIASLHEDRKNAADALEAQAREIEGLRKDAALVAARERERCENAVENSSSCFTSDQAYIKKLAVAAIRAINTEGEGLDVATAQKGESK